MDINLVLEAFDSDAAFRRKTAQPLKFKGNAEIIALMKSDGSGTIELDLTKIDWKSGSWRVKDFIDALKKEGYKPEQFDKAIKDEAVQFQTKSGREISLNQLDITYTWKNKPVFAAKGNVWDFFGKLQAMLKLLD